MNKKVERIFKAVILIVVFFSVCNLRGEDLGMEDFVNSAVKNNYQILLSRQSVRASKGEKTASWGRFFPRLSLEYSSAYIDKPQEFKIDFPVGSSGGEVIYKEASIEMGQKDNYQGRISVYQPIFTFGNISTSYAIADDAYRIQKTRKKNLRIQVISEVRKAFYRVLFFNEMVDILTRQKTLMEENLDITEKLYRAGKASNLDISRVKVHLARSQSALIEARSNLKVAKERLFNLSRMKKEDNKIKGELEYRKYDFNLDELIDMGLKNRSEIIMSDISIEIEKKKHRLSYLNNMPQIYAYGSYNYERPFLNRDEWGDYWSVGGEIKFPFLDGLSLFGRLNKTKAELEKAKINKESIIEAVKLEIKNRFYEFQKAQEKIRVEKENLSRAEKNLEISNKRYARGLLSNLELNQAILDYITSRIDLNSSIFSYLSAIENLNTAVGKEMTDK